MKPKATPMRLTKKEAAIVESCYFQPHYSSNASTKFWREVRHAVNDGTLYGFACGLQELEASVLAAVNTGIRIRAQKLILAQRVRPKTTRRITCK